MRNIAKLSSRVLALAIASSLPAVGEAASVTIANTENEDLLVQVRDQNAAGAIVYPTSGQACALLAAGDSVTVTASDGNDGQYSLTWVAEQDLSAPLVSVRNCSNQPSEVCRVDMTEAVPSASHCR